MNQRLAIALVFTLCLCGTASAQPPGPSANSSSTPAWLPRGALLGTSLQQGVVMPQARLQWQGLFYESYRDSLGVFLEPMAAFSAATPSALVAEPFGTVPPGSLTSLRLYSLQVGVEYSNRQDSGLEWGFQVGTGPAWFQARFQGALKDQEVYWVGLLDGRARLGYRVGPIGLGLAVGYGDPYGYKRASLAHAFVGGLQLGLYADWR